MPLFMRTTDKDGKSRGGLQWPMEVGAVVVAPDWKPTAECGNGLHGLLNGEGDSSHLSTYNDAIWWIVEADEAVDLAGKHKFKSCRVVAFGSRADITPMMRRMTGGAVHFLVEAGGHRATLTGGNYATLTGGDGATLTGGDDATLTGGNYATLTGGDGATLTGGNYATLTGGDDATLTGGDGATLIFLRWIYGRRRILTAYVGEDGIEPNVSYRASDDHKTITRVTELSK